MKLVVGLGNPGRRYQKTRHNTGFMFIDCVAKAFNIKFKLDKDKQCEIGMTNIAGKKIILIKPQTYMNNSGIAVLKVINYYQISLDDVIIIYDDLDLDVAKIKIKPQGSSGGHKGMQSIINHLKTTEIKRIRIGISKEENTIDHVLSKFSKDEKKAIDFVFNQAPDIIIDFASLSFEAVMNKYN